MKKLLPFLFILIFFSCQKNSFILSDDFRVRTHNADLPVYAHGNSEKNIFIIFIHGGPGDSGYQNRAGTASEELEKRYVMVYWDQRGQGQAEGNFNSDEISIDLMAEDLNSVVDVLKNKYGNDIKIFLLGHSWGGTLGTAFLLKNDYQNKINGWIEVDGSHDFPKINRDVLQKFVDVGTEQINLNNNTENWQNIVDWAKQVDTSNLDKETIIEINDKSHLVEKYLLEDSVIQREDAATIRDFAVYYHQNIITRIFSGNYTFMGNDKFFNEVVTNSFTDDLYKITIPCLFLWGKYDFVVPSTLGYDAYNRVGAVHKQIIIFDKSGHSPMLNQSNDFVNAVTDFVETYK